MEKTKWAPIIHNKSLGPFLILGLVAFAIYARTLGFDFLSYDDNEHLSNNPVMHLPMDAAFAKIWSGPHFGLYIPLTYSVWRLVAEISHAPWIFHGLSVACHALNALLVYFWITQVMPESKSRVPALVGALLFVVHPLQVESVAWVAEFRGLLSAGLCLGAMIIHLRSQGRAWLKIATLFALGLLAKPSAAMLPAVLLLQDWVLLKRRTVKELAPTSAYLILTLLFLGITKSIQGADGDIEFIPDVFGRLRICAESLVFYVSKFSWPTALIPIYLKPAKSIVESQLTFAKFAVPVVLVIGCIATLKKWPLLGFGLIVAVVGLLPILGLIPFRFQNFSIVADHYFYFSLVGLSLVLAKLLDQAYAQSDQKFVIASVTAGLGLAIFSVMSFQQSSLWRDDESLYGGMMQVVSRHYIAMASLGSYYLGKQDLKKAEPLIRESISIWPLHYPAQQSLGALLLNEQRYQDLVDDSRAWFPVNPHKLETFRINIAHMHHYLGVAYHSLNINDQAITQFNEALNTQPHFGYADDAHFRLAALYLMTGDQQNAANHFRAYIKIGHDEQKLDAAMKELQRMNGQ